MRRVRRATAMMLLGTLPACYRHVPVPLESLKPAERVQVSLAPAAAQQVEEAIGVRQQVITARFSGRTPSAVALLVPSSGAGGFGARDLHQQILIAPADVLGVQHLEVDRQRTGMLVGTAAVAAALLVAAIFSGQAGETPSPTPPQPAEVRLPAF